MLLYMLQVTQQISRAAQHYRFQLILISTDVASLSHKAGSFLCKLKLLDQGIVGNYEMDKTMPIEACR